MLCSYREPPQPPMSPPAETSGQGQRRNLRPSLDVAPGECGGVESLGTYLGFLGGRGRCGRGLMSSTGHGRLFFLSGGVAESSREPPRHCPSSSKVQRCLPPSQRVATHFGMACAASKWDFRWVIEWSWDGGSRFVKYVELGQGQSNPDTGVFCLSISDSSTSSGSLRTLTCISGIGSLCQRNPCEWARGGELSPQTGQSAS